MQGGGEAVCVEHTGAELTFFQQCIKLVEERQEMDNDTRTNDAHDSQVDQSYTKKQWAICQFSFCWGGLWPTKRMGEGIMHHLAGDEMGMSSSHAWDQWVQ